MTSRGKEDPANQAFRETMLRSGIYFEPQYVNRAFISGAHTEDDIDKMLDVAVEFLRDNDDMLR